MRVHVHTCGGGEKRAEGEGKLSGFSFIHLITISNIVTKVYLKGPHTIHSFKFHKAKSVVHTEQQNPYALCKNFLFSERFHFLLFSRILAQWNVFIASMTQKYIRSEALKAVLCISIGY